MATILINGANWLQGDGSDVFSNEGNYSTYYQCVELPQIRLYPKMGWPKVYCQNGGANSIPEGSPGLTFYPTGSGYLPVPGDLIIENGTGTNPYGHVAVVDYVEGNNICAVEQNASASGRHTYAYNNSNYSGGYGSVRGICHAPNNDNGGETMIQNFDNVHTLVKLTQDRVANFLPNQIEKWTLKSGTELIVHYSAVIIGQYAWNQCTYKLENGDYDTRWINLKLANGSEQTYTIIDSNFNWHSKG